MDTSALPKAVELAGPAACGSRWKPGLPLPLHSEIFASAEEASGVGLALALAIDELRRKGEVTSNQRGVLWVQDARAIKLAGRPYRAGLPEALRHRLVYVAAKSPEDALFALEEGLRCRDMAVVVGELAGNPRALDFTASRRLSLTAEKHGVPLLLVRLDAEPDLSSARMRWRLASEPSYPPRWNTAAPGRPAWRAELFRARTHLPGEWILRDEPDRLTARRFPVEQPAASASDHGDLVHATGARSLAAR